MFAELISAIQESVRNEMVTISGRIFTTQEIHPVPMVAVAPLRIITLSSFVDYVGDVCTDDESLLPQSIARIEINGESRNAVGYIAQVKPNEVNLYSTIQEDGSRRHLMRAEAPDFGFSYGQYMDREAFQIGINQWFADNDTKANLLTFLGSMQTATILDLIDDGLSQTVKTKKEVVGTGQTTIKPIVKLLPRDCFPEITPVERELIFRIKKDGEAIKCALFTAGDGLHNLNRVLAIKKYLGEQIEYDWVEVIG